MYVCTCNVHKPLVKISIAISLSSRIVWISIDLCGQCSIIIYPVLLCYELKS
jgi:hypothetical protein